jgi:hypothetical protein
MLMTHFAILDQGERKPGLLQRIWQHLASFLCLGEEPEPVRHEPIARPSTRRIEAPLTEPILRVVAVEPDIISQPDGFRWRRHPQLLGQPGPDLLPSEREARHEAVRGLFAARAGALECAATHFAEAARCEQIDLSAIPGFWQLDRTAMMTAVDAYERAGRIREASALNARIRTMYRPRALTSIPTNVTHMPQTPSKVSSNS